MPGHAHLIAGEKCLRLLPHCKFRSNSTSCRQLRGDYASNGSKREIWFLSLRVEAIPRCHEGIFLFMKIKNPLFYSFISSDPAASRLIRTLQIISHFSWKLPRQLLGFLMGFCL